MNRKSANPSAQELFFALSDFVCEQTNNLKATYERCDYLARSFEPQAVQEAQALLQDPFAQGGQTCFGFLYSAPQETLDEIGERIDNAAQIENKQEATVPASVARWALLKIRTEALQERWRQMEPIIYFCEGDNDAFKWEDAAQVQQLYSYFCVMMIEWREVPQRDYSTHFANVLECRDIPMPQWLKAQIIADGGMVLERVVEDESEEE